MHTVRIAYLYRAHVVALSSVGLALSSPSRASQACTSSGDSASYECYGGGANDICQSVGGGVIVCDLSRNTDGPGATAMANYNAGTSLYEIKGAEPTPTGSDPTTGYCCRFSPSGVTRLEVLGTSYDDIIKLNRNGSGYNLEAPTGTITGYVTGRDGDDEIWGSCATTHEQDDLRGGNHNDTIYGCAGDDYIYGEFGEDDLIGNLGDDTIFGGDDDDYIWGREDADIISGGSGNDHLMGNEGGDTITGDDGDDYIWGGPGIDYLNGNAGEDEIAGEDDGDFINGGSDDDILCGNDSVDSLTGESGDDFIYGNAGDDTVFGATGYDTIWGGAGNDTLHGDSDTDYITGGTGADYITGDDGQDFLCGDREPTDLMDTLDGGAGDDRIWGPALTCSDTLSTRNQGDAGSGNDNVDNCSFPAYINSEGGLSTRPTECPVEAEEDCPIGDSPAPPGGGTE